MSEGLAFLAAGLLMLPNTICQLIPICRKRHTAPFLSYLWSLCINAGYGLLFSSETQEIAYILIGIGFFFTIIPFDCCICSSSFQCNHAAAREIFAKPLSRKDFIREMCGNRALPPSISVYAEAYHYETRTETVKVDDGDGKSHYETRTHEEKVTTWTGTKIFKYRSWQEDGNSIRIKETDIVHAACPVHYKLDSSAREGLSYLRERMYFLALCHDYYASVSNSFTTPGIRDIICGSISESSTQTTQFFQGCGGRTLWIFFTILGYQSAFETFWCQKGERMRLRLKKKISGHKGTYRCGFMEEDGEAARNTFRFDGESVVIDTPLLSNFYEGPPINPEYLIDLPDDPKHPPPECYRFGPQPPMPPQGMPPPMPPQGMQMNMNMQPGMQMNMQMQGMQPPPMPPQNMQMNMQMQGVPPPMQPQNMQMNIQMQPGMPQPQQGMPQQGMQMNMQMQGMNAPMQPGMQSQPTMQPGMNMQMNMQPGMQSQPNMQMNMQPGMQMNVNVQGPNQPPQ